jgi:serine/threonine protein kinase
MDPFMSDPLRGWRLETTYDDIGRRYHQRPSGAECWRAEQLIGNGTFGDVWQERCVSGTSQNAIRAVKHLHKRQSKFLEMSRRELDALVTFSDPDTLEVGVSNIEHGTLAAN